MRSTFIFYSSFRETANKLNKEDRADFYEAIIEYSLTGVEPKLTGIVDIVFTAIKTTIDNQLNNYENGKKGGRPKKENPINENEKEGFKNEKNPPFENEKSYKEKEKYKDEYKEKEKESVLDISDNLEQENENEHLHTFSKNEEIKTETKQEINPDLKNLVANSSKSENKPTEIINFYRDNISSKYEDIQEQASYNQIMIKNYDLYKILIGLKNYARYLQVSKGKPVKLFFFVRDGIYLDYQVEAPVTMGKNSVIVPIELVGKVFVVDGESIEFESNGYNKVGKDWKVTNAKNVEEMVNLVRGNVA